MTSNIQTAAATMAKKRHEKSSLNVIVKPLAEKLYFQTKSENHVDYENVVFELVAQKVLKEDEVKLDKRVLKKWLIEWQEKEHRSK
jgi:hypothetical protein